MKSTAVTEFDPYVHPPETPCMDIYIQPQSSNSFVSSSDNLGWLLVVWGLMAQEPFLAKRDNLGTFELDAHVLFESRTCATDMDGFRVPLPPSKRAKTIASSCEAVSGKGITP
ncbi:hypothetical protein AVEN_192280-1 [Araneus ventricosus]|uniref:Uncharacterized protein n=1 Tax=Araneus ventricosus TaxID=182803 RepID=A0A4Y2TUB8_ARAVE|nr:hypothetical protein AVEN_192280-1 [Araneus ventricosus]